MVLVKFVIVLKAKRYVIINVIINGVQTMSAKRKKGKLFTSHLMTFYDGCYYVRTCNYYDRR